MTKDSRSTLRARHREALALFGERVHAVRPRQWSAPTPCSEWTVRDLVNHLTAEQLWVPRLLAGASVEDVGDELDGDVLGDDPPAVWDAAAEAAVAAFGARGALQRTVRLSYGETAVEDYCAEMTADAVVHAWDLARAIGAPERPPEPLVAAAGRVFGSYGDDMSPTGLFAAPVPAPPDADDWTRLLARLGRAV
ncbi:TIGR03086 family metal-binding protein [Streptomyces mobaraensis]|uniref:TIGR03086 family protein n=1 Tax=Streptomyces mobaraensis TaxID=35621 RepID=A0A5N5W924_STRMB|nr:TIGR03086 family metal-binding protein [Streptomyces mobaraensis]KAB7845019.1 TIGR03086 family protein [Streptomyces mobaraensis]